MGAVRRGLLVLHLAQAEGAYLRDGQEVEAKGRTGGSPSTPVQ